MEIFKSLSTCAEDQGSARGAPLYFRKMLLIERL
jgi:hypothetical protein